MRDLITDRSGNLLGSTLYTPQSGKTTLLDRSGNLCGWSQNGKAFDRSGNLVGSAATLNTLLPINR